MPFSMPVSPQELTPALLTELAGELRPGLGIDAVDIVDIKSYGDADNNVSVSTSARVTIDVRYGPGAPASLPTRLLAKMSIPEDAECSNPPLDAEFINEVAFYNRLRPELELETPLGLGGRYDPVSQRYVLLMEDVSVKSVHFNSMIDDNNVAVVEAVLDTLAKLHAQYWNSPRFETDLAWVENQVEGDLEDLFDEFVHAHILNEIGRERFKRELVEDLGTTDAELQAGLKALKRHQATLPQTFLHGDAHYGNSYVLPDGTGGLLDWQVNARGFLTHDIAYLIQTALSVEARRKNERELLAFYRDRLCSYGVKEAPDAELLWLEYRRSMLYGFYMGWITAPRENYGLEVCVLGNNRTASAYRDHEAGKLIKEIL